MKFATADVLGVSTGRLLGEIGGIYKVVSFLLGRSAYTHELAYYGRRAAAAIRTARPDLPSETEAEHVTGDNYRESLAAWERQFGSDIDLPDSIRECLADEKNAIGTLTEMVGPEKIIVINPRQSQ